MAGGNRYKHRSLGGGLVPNNQQAPSNNFYVAPTKRDYLAEALALAQAGLQGTAEAGLTGIGEALSNPTKSLAALLTPGSGALAVNDALAKPAADQLVKDWGGVKPAMQAGSDVMALADILSGKEKSVPFAPAYAGQKASDALVNAGTAALDTSTFLPTGVARSKFDDVPSLSKFDEFATALDAKNAAAMADNSGMGVGSMAQMPRSGGPSFGRDPTRVARVQSSQDPTTLGMGFPFSGKDGEKPLLSALMDAFKGKPKESPLDQFTPPTSIDDIFTGGGPRAPREITGGAENPAGLESSFFNDPRFNGPQEAVPYNPESGFGGLDARLGKQTLPEGVSVIPNPSDLPPSMAGEANYRIALKNGPPVNVRISGRDGRITWEFADQAAPENKVAAGKEAVRRVQDVLAYHSKIAPDQTFYFEGATPAHSKLYDALLGRDSGGYDVSRKPGADGFEKTVITPAADKNARTLSEALAKRAKPPGYDDWSPEWRAAYDKGLDMSQEARMARAREQGFNVDEPLYHGTTKDITQFKPGLDGQLGPGMYFGPQKMVAPYAKGDGAQIYPVLLRDKSAYFDPRNPTVNAPADALGNEGDDVFTSRFASKDQLYDAKEKFQGSVNASSERIAAAWTQAQEKLQSQGYRGAKSYDPHTKQTEYVTWDPANIRSPSAAFDPDNVGKPTLLGAGSPFEGKIGKKDMQAIEIDAGQIVQRRRKLREINQLTEGDVLQPLNYEQGREIALWLHKNPDARKTFNQYAPDLWAEYLKKSGKGSTTNMGAPADDLIKLLMAYGAFGGMSAGALATMDAQQKAPLANQRGF